MHVYKPSWFYLSLRQSIILNHNHQREEAAHPHSSFFIKWSFIYSKHVFHWNCHLIATKFVPDSSQSMSCVLIRILHCIQYRLYSHPTYHKRESCVSEVTTTTLVTINGGSATKSASNGGGAQVRSPFLHPPRPSYGGNV